MQTLEVLAVLKDGGGGMHTVSTLKLGGGGTKCFTLSWGGGRTFPML